MAAPKTITLKTPIVKNQKTLIWLRDQDITIDWSKWDGVVSTLKEYEYWFTKSANVVGIVLTDVSGDPNDFFDNLVALAQNVEILLLSEKVLSHRPNEFWQSNFKTILILEHAIRSYPFIENAWDGTMEDAIGIFALLCRYNRLVDCVVSDERAAVLNPYIQLVSGIIPNQVWLITQFFKHKDTKRYLEIKECLSKNCECPFIDKIVLINEKDLSSYYKNIPGSNKIRQVISGQRLSYADFIQYVLEHVPDNVYVILANADIYFGDSLLDLWKINMEDKMLGLLRWDVDEKGESKLFGPRTDSQDSWIFLSNSIKARKWDLKKYAFYLGQPGCDNTFTTKILRERFLISNPALSFKTFHLHNTNIRNYTYLDTVLPDFDIHLAPSNVLNCKQEAEPNTKKMTLSNETVSFEIKSSSMSNEITVCTMLERDGRYKWEPSVENYFFQAAIPVYSWKNAAVTPNSLVYDLYNLYMGKHVEDPNFNFWMECEFNNLSQLQKTDTMLAVPFKNTENFRHPDLYILNYISRCARLLKHFPTASFWIPGAFLEHVKKFNWGQERVNGVLFDEKRPCWANEVIGFLPGPSMLELGKEDISVLREMLPSWISKPVRKTCAVVLADAITRKFAEERLAPLLKGLHEEWDITFVVDSEYASYDALYGVSLCIFVGGKNARTNWAKLWALPEECCVIEFQQELRIDGEFQHLAHVAGFTSWVLLLAKGPILDVQEQIVEQLEKWFKKNGGELQG